MKLINQMKKPKIKSVRAVGSSIGRGRPVYISVSNSVYDSVWFSVSNSVRNSVSDSVSDSVRESVINGTNEINEEA